MNLHKERILTSQDIWKIVRGKWWLIVLGASIGFFAGIYLNYTSIPQYRSATLVFVEDKNPQAQSIFQISNASNSDRQLNNEMAILRSRTVITSVIDTLINSEKTNLFLFGKKSHHKIPNLQRLLSFLPWISAVQEDTIFHEIPEHWTESDIRNAASRLRSNLSISPVKGTGLLSISVTAPDPEEAALLSNTVSRIYQHLDISRSRADILGVKEFLSSRLSKVGKALEESERKIVEHQEEQGVINISSSAENLISQSSKFESNYLSLQTEIEALSKKLEIQRSLLSDTEKALIDEACLFSDPLIENLRKEIAGLETSLLSKNIGGYSENDLWIISTQNKINELRSLLKLETEKMLSSKMVAINPLEHREKLLTDIFSTETELQTKEVHSDALLKINKNYERKINQLPAKILEYVRLERDRQINENVFLLLKTKHVEYGISEQTKLGSIQIIDPALPNYAPISPNKQKNMILATIVGLVLCIVVLVVLEVFDNTVRTKADLEEFNLPLLGMVPFAVQKNGFLWKRSTNRNPIQAFRNRLISHFDSKSPISESYRHLRTSLHFIQHDGRLKTITMLSAGQKEGKSATAINLGITYSQLGKKTLLVDSDLRKPIIHRVFRCEKEHGLTDVLNDGLDLDVAIEKTDIENFSVLSCGTIPPNPSEILASKEMDNLIEKLKERFDKIIFDTPPVNAVADGAIVSKKCDGAVLVAFSNSTHRDSLAHAVEYLERIDANLLGIVLNGIRKHHATPSHYYYYYGKD